MKCDLCGKKQHDRLQDCEVGAVFLARARKPGVNITFATQADRKVP